MADQFKPVATNFEQFTVELPDGNTAIDIEAIATHLVLGFKMGVGYGNFSDQEAFVRCHMMIDALWPTLATRHTFDKSTLN